MNVTNEIAAWNTLGGYLNLIGVGPQRLIVDPGIIGAEKNFDIDLLRLKILKVTGGGNGLQPIRRVGCIVNGVNPNGFNTILTATWLVKWVEIPAP